MTAPLITLDELLALNEALWPHVTFYDRQVEIAESWCDVRETVVAAGTEEGKDFMAGFLSVATPLICQAKGLTFKLLTTSVTERQLKVLWGEIGRFISTSTRPLLASAGGPLIVNHMEIRLASEIEAKNPFNYVMGVVYEKAEVLQGHYADFNGVIGDEASGLENDAYVAVQPMKRLLWIGNTNPCSNFYRKAIKDGNLTVNNKLVRKVIRITAWDSPNVKLAQQEIKRGEKPSGCIVTPGVITWDSLQTYLKIWPEHVQDIKLRAKFPSDAGVLLFPEEWLEAAKRRAVELDSGRLASKRQAKAIGIDPAEGGDRTAFCVIDEHGVLELISMKTPDTTATFDHTLALMRRWGVPADKIVFDRACGKPHADRLRGMGFKVQTVHFGESLLMDLKRGIIKIEDKRENREEKSLYKNRRAEMYHDLAAKLNPANGGFAIPARFAGVPRPEFSLFDQLAPVPYMFDKESGDGKLMLPPKDEMISGLYDGHGSPDEADALVLAIYGLTHKSLRARAGAA